MMELAQMRIMNDTMIEYLKRIGMSCKRNEIIKKILEDEACFFKMTKEQAYVILKDIGVLKEKMDKVYASLISNEIYYNLYKNNQIKENDNEIIIKYKIYNPDNLFKPVNNQDAKTEKKEKQLVIVGEEKWYKKILKKILAWFKR